MAATILREKLDTNQLKAAYRGGRRNFSNTDLTGINPTGFRLPNIDLSGAVLRDADITWLAVETMKGLRSAEFERTIVTPSQRDFILLSRGQGERKIPYDQIEKMFILGEDPRKPLKERYSEALSKPSPDFI